MALTASEQADFQLVSEMLDAIRTPTPVLYALARIRVNYERMREGRPTLAQQGHEAPGVESTP